MSETIRPASWVQADTAKSLLSLYESLSLSEAHIREERKQGRDTFMIFNPSKKQGSILTLYERQKNAVQELLTSSKLKSFWEAATPEQRKNLEEVCKKAFNDWNTKPNITVTEKKKKLKQAKGHVEKIISIMGSDPSLQREISIALTEAVNAQWKCTENVGGDGEALEIIHAGKFIRGLAEEIENIRSSDNWQSTHRGYPTQIKATSAEKQFFIRRFSPIFYQVLGENNHAAIVKILSTLFPHFSVTPDMVRKANAE